MSKVIILLMLICGGVFGSKDLDLFNAAGKGSLASVTESLASVADPNWRNPAATGRSALHVAALGNHVDVVKFLLDNGAEKDLQDDIRATPLYLAARKGSTATIETLISYGAGVDIPAMGGWTALHAAARNNQIGAMEVLLERGGADKDQKDDDGRTPLCCAALEGNTEAVEVLINAKANLDQQDDMGWTALHWAASMNKPSLAKLLLKNGANASIKNGNGLTPGDVARREGYYRLANTIDNFTGANTTTTDTYQPIVNREEL